MISIISVRSSRWRARRRWLPAGAIGTIVLISILAALSVGALDYLVLRAAWQGGPEACRATAGACWPFAAERASAMVFGYLNDRQRLAIVAAALLIVVALGFARSNPKRGLRLVLAILVLCGIATLAAHRIGWPGWQGAELGGLILTIAVAGFGIATGLPLGLALALMRSSNLPVLRILATVWIEIWRGVPTVVILFFAIAVFPLFVPKELEIGKLLRALFAFSLLTSALFAEAFRGALYAVGDGQREAAISLGLGSVRTLRLIVLPQALAVALPNLVNICVALVKETTLVYLIGLYDLFGVVQTAVIEPRWAGTSATGTGYLMAAGGFLIICAGLSHCAQRLERRLKTGT